MIEVVGIKFHGNDKIYYYNPQKVVFEKGEKCIVETLEGSAEAEISLPNFFLEPNKITAPVRRILRFLTDKKEIFAQKKQKDEEEAKKFCTERIDSRHMAMKLVEVKYTDDMKKVVFFFVSENRVDFRELLKDLVKALRVKIELRQISRREYAKKIGGMGICGRVSCCKNHLKSFYPITIKMAKVQGLPLNPTKISGICGRLLCCLAYEKYDHAVKPILPHIEDQANIASLLVDEGGAETDVNWND